ncbi:hypothetical protein [Kitasatospora paracochleata]|uniref:Uncharacterized protein n=1 Tax=Kitasatospora paracochleata TaxID=58354 RepID=A0ABT1JA32_9ACTN|nr:hypothetical protein [Kitasatospora paracochleata]MCP2314316.1 hypothetical protein [Kitasatospora paracochleata]
MGHTAAFPLLRTTDLDAIFSLADRLLALSVPDPRGDTEISARVSSRAEVRRLLEAVPEAEVGEGAKEDAATPGDSPLPFGPYLLFMDLPDPERAPNAARAALGVRDRIEVYWEAFCWPEVPELGLDRTWKYAALQVSLHHNGTDFDSPWTEDHTLFVHVDGEERAVWVAAQVGAEIIGEHTIC